jgi:uncharacterized membrane protein
MTVMRSAALLLLLILPLIAIIGWPRNRFRRVRDSISLLLRGVIILLVILALADLQIVRSSDRLAVVFLVDVSDSMDSASQDAAEGYIRDALGHMQVNDLAGVIAFGADAQVARSMSSINELGPVRVSPQSGNTNLAAAVRLGLALFPGDAARRLVVLSDGQPTIGDTMASAQLAAAAGVEISYVSYTHAPTPEIQVRDVIVPTVLHEDQEFNLTVTVTSEEDTRATITVYAAGNIMSRQERELFAGDNTFTLQLRSGASGFRDFSVQVDPPESDSNFEDGFYQNNKLSAFSQVIGAPRVLVVSMGDEAETRYLLPALVENGLEVDHITPIDLPTNITGLADYESVVLVNVPATALSFRDMDVLQRYVGDLGHGLVVIGGDQAYGLGGYFQTQLEEILPLEMRLKDQERMPELTIAYVIDRSGSMGITLRSGDSKLMLAQEAIIRSLDFLQPTDRAGIASFDVNAYWIAEFQEVSNRQELQRLVATMRPGGGTSIMAGMQLVSRDIIEEPSAMRHLIFLTDGGSDPYGLVTMARDLRINHNVTTSVISIAGAESSFLEEMAVEGGGHYHRVDDPINIPTVFAQETVLATRAYIQEDTFVPTLTAIHPMMQNIETMPPLLGYVATEPRAAAQVILRGPEPYQDPILAAWQYGLGRSVAFTGDATAQWALNWVDWDQFATFWSQVVRWTIVEGASTNLETQVVLEDEQARVIVDARKDDGDFLNGLNLQLNVVYGTAQGSQQVLLRQVAPGRYEGVFTPTEEGAYLLRVTQMNADPEDTATTSLNQTTGWVLSYSQEYAVRENVDDTVLETIAGITGGRDLSDQNELAFEHNIVAQEAFVPLWPWLLLVAMLLLPFDIGVRRLLVTQSDLQRLWEWLFGREEPDTDADARMSTLKQARDRVRHRVRRTGAVEEEEISAPSQTIGALRSRKEQARAERAPQDGEQPELKPSYKRKRVRPNQPVTPRSKPEGNIGERLLRRRQQSDEDEE